MTYPQFLDLVERMRGKQREYFRTRDRSVLNESKALERQVDRFIENQKTPRLI